MLAESDAANIDHTLKGKPSISSIKVLTTGSVELHREHRLGSKAPRLWWVLTSKSWIKAPLSFFLIDHVDGQVLFDTGIDPAILSNPQYIASPIGRFLLKKIFRFQITEKDSLDRVLANEGIAATDIRKAVISHLHFDHVGGIAHIPQAELLVSEREWEQLSDPHPEREWMLGEHIKIPQARWKPFSFSHSDDPLFKGFDGIYDVVGDGSMILLPTPGHTPGSLSMLIRRPGWSPILLVADLAYEAALIEKGTTPGTGDATQCAPGMARSAVAGAH